MCMRRSFKVLVVNIPLWPNTFGALDTSFVCQSSSIEFVTAQGIDLSQVRFLQSSLVGSAFHCSLVEQLSCICNL